MAKKPLMWLAALIVTVATVYAVSASAHDWKNTDFANRPLYAYPLPEGRDDIVGTLTTYKIQPGDTLLDVGRWFGLSAKEVSDANHHMDWWLPPPGATIILPTEHILPAAPHNGIIMNIPEMRLYYYYPSSAYRRRHGKTELVPASFRGARVVYTFPVGLGRYDWKTPIGKWTVTAKVKDPAWVLPEDIYEEHLERDGEADHMIPGGDPDNPLGHYKLDLSIPEYGLHGTNVPWGVGMTVSHGCVRLYPEDIDRLFHKVPVGTPGDFVYEPVKFGWRGGAIYVEVHEDLYGKYPALWSYAQQLARARGLTGDIDMDKLEKAVEAKSGIPTYIGMGSEPSPSTISAPPVNASGESASAPAVAPAAGSETGSESASAGAESEPDPANSDDGAWTRSSAP